MMKKRALIDDPCGTTGNTGWLPEKIKAVKNGRGADLLRIKGGLA